MGAGGYTGARRAWLRSRVERLDVQACVWREGSKDSIWYTGVELYGRPQSRAYMAYPGVEFYLRVPSQRYNDLPSATQKYESFSEGRGRMLHKDKGNNRGVQVAEAKRGGGC